MLKNGLSRLDVATHATAVVHWSNFRYRPRADIRLSFPRCQVSVCTMIISASVLRSSLHWDQPVCPPGAQDGQILPYVPYAGLHRNNAAQRCPFSFAQTLCWRTIGVHHESRCLSRSQSGCSRKRTRFKNCTSNGRHCCLTIGDISWSN